jgi:hypothetical protein
VSFAATTLCVAYQRVFIVVVVAAAAYFVIDSVRKLLDTPSYILQAEVRMVTKSLEGYY